MQEKGLRYLEDVEKQFEVTPEAEPIKPSDLQYGLTSHFVERLRQAYKAVLTNEVSYRAYKISSNEEGVDFIGQPRLYEARNYFKGPDFYTLLAHLIHLQQSNEQAFGELKKLWEVHTSMVRCHKEALYSDFTSWQCKKCFLWLSSEL